MKKYKKYIQFKFLELEWQVLVERIITCMDTSKCYKEANQKIYFYSKNCERGTAVYLQLMSFTQLLVLILSNENWSWKRENLIINLIVNCECLLDLSDLPEYTFYYKTVNLPENAGFLDHNGVLQELYLFRYLIKNEGLRIRSSSKFIFTDAVFFWCLPADQAAAIHDFLFLLSKQYRGILN